MKKVIVLLLLTLFIYPTISHGNPIPEDEIIDVEILTTTLNPDESKRFDINEYVDGFAKYTSTRYIYVRIETTYLQNHTYESFIEHSIYSVRFTRHLEFFYISYLTTKTIGFLFPVIHLDFGPMSDSNFTINHASNNIYFELINRESFTSDYTLVIQTKCSYTDDSRFNILPPAFFILIGAIVSLLLLIIFRLIVINKKRSIRKLKKIKVCKMCGKKRLIPNSKKVCKKCRIRLNKLLKPCPQCNKNSLYYKDGFQFHGNFSYRTYYCENCGYSNEVELDCG